MDPKKFIGTWRLVSQVRKTTEGSIDYPLGENAIGLLMYGADGFMSVSLMRADRKPFASEWMIDGSDAQKKEAFESYMSYSGRYRVEENKMTHIVEMSLFPNRTGREETRYFTFSDDRLILTTPAYTFRGKETVAQIT